MPQDSDPKSEEIRHISTTLTKSWSDWRDPVHVENYFDHVWFYSWREWHRQQRPFISTMKYETRRSRVWPVAFRELTYIGTIGGIINSDYAGCVSVDYSGTEAYTASLDYQRVLADTQNACLDLVKGQSWNSAVFAAEFSKTSQLVRDLARSISDGYKAFRQFKRSPSQAFRTMSRAFSGKSVGRHIKHNSQKFSSLWLQYRYGISTGILDIQEAAKTAAQIMGAHQKAERVIRVNRTAVVTSSESWRSGTFGWVGAPAGDCDATFTGQISCSAWIRCSPDSVHSITWEASQLGLLNPAAVLYELTFLSFVADWVLDIGNYLERLGALTGIRVVDAGYSITRRGVGVYRPVNSRDGYYYKVRSGTPITVESQSYKRLRWEDPSPVWTPGVSMTTRRWVDAAALIRVVALKRVK